MELCALKIRHQRLTITDDGFVETSYRDETMSRVPSRLVRTWQSEHPDAFVSAEVEPQAGSGRPISSSTAAARPRRTRQARLHVQPSTGVFDIGTAINDGLATM